MAFLTRTRARRIAVGLLALLGCTYLFIVCTTIGQRIDETVWEWVSSFPRGRRTAYRIVRWLGPPSQVLMCGLILLIGGFLRRGWRVLLTGAAAMMACVLVVEAMKYGLPRPDLTASKLGWNNSFPSGHTAGASAVLVGAVLVAPAGALRRLCAWLGAIYVAAMGLAVVMAHMHRPSDPFGSYLAAGAVGLLAWATLPESEPHQDDPSLAWPATRGAR